MAKKQTKPPAQKPEEKQTKALVARPGVEMTRMGLMPTNLDEAYRFAQYQAGSDLVPENYRNKPNDCVLIIDLSMRLGVPWMMLMQHMYIVHGRPAMDAMLCTALVNKSGVFTDPVDYEVKGLDPFQDDYMVRAYAVRKSTGKTLYGPWINWRLVRGEAWDKKAGSKWLTMPDQMFHYRAASWFAKRHCPGEVMGMMTLEEAEELGPKHVDATVVQPGNEGLKKLLAEQEANGKSEPGPEATEQPQGESTPNDEAATPPDNADERDEQTDAKVQAEKDKLAAAFGGPSGAKGNGKSNLF